MKIQRWNLTPGHDSTLNCDPGSWFHVELRPRVLIPRWIVTPSQWFNVKLWPGIRITIQCGILTRGHNSTWNFDPGSQLNVIFWPRVTIQRGIFDPSTYLLPVELRLKKVSKFNSVIKIQQLMRVTIQRKIHLNIDPGSLFNRGVKIFILHRPWARMHKKNLELS